MPSKQFYYDRSEVTGAVRKDAEDATVNSMAYSFDNIGNRMTSAEDGTDKNYAANQLNQYTAISNPAISPTYDDDGNMLAAHGWTLTWDAENRLKSAGNGTARLEFVYDAYSRRREKKVYASDVLTKHEKYLYNGYKMIAVFDALNEDARIMTFLWQPVELDIPLCMTYNNETYYYLADGNKNITGLFDSTGNRVATYTYAPFGELLSSSGTMASVNPFRFSSEQYDTETSLVYYNYRYYSPILGRWLSRDPIEEKGGWNLYVFLLNKMIFFDVNGLSKGGKQNISAEEFTLKSDPNEVREKISELKMEKNQLDRKCNRKEIQDITNRLNKLRGILKVILRNQKFIFLIFIPSIDTKIEEIERNRREKFREQHGLGGNIA